jgi:hypothetical protein
MAKKLIIMVNTDPRNGKELGAPFFQERRGILRCSSAASSEWRGSASSAAPHDHSGSAKHRFPLP